MATYRGQAQSQGFDPVKIPDTARRMMEAAERKRKAQERAYTLDIQQQDRYNSAIENKNRREEYEVKQNMNQMDAYQRAYRDQLKENYAALTEKDRVKTAQDIQNISRLGEFSQSALKLADDLKQNYKDEQEDFGRSLVAKYRVSKEDYNQLRMSEADLQAEGAANNQIVELLKSRNASPDEIAAIRKLDGWRLYGAQQEWAKSGGKNFANYLDKNRDKKFEIDDGVQISLNEAKEYQDGKFYGIIQDQLIAEYSKPYGNLDPAFASEYFYPKIDEAVRKENLDYITARNDILREQETNARLTEVNNLTGPEDTMRHIRSQGLDNPGNFNRFFDTISTMLENPGTFKQGVDAFNWFLVAPSGQDPKQNHKQLYLESKTISAIGTRMNELLLKIDEQGKISYEKKENTKTLKYNQAMDELRPLIPTMSLQQILQTDIELRKNSSLGNKGLPQDMLRYGIQTEGLNDKLLKQYVYQAQESGVSLSNEQIDFVGRNASAEMRVQLKKANSAASVYDHNKIKKTIVSDLKSLMKDSGTVDHGLQIDMMANMAMKEFSKVFQQSSESMSPTDSLRAAQEHINKELTLAASSNKGMFRLVEINNQPAVGLTGGFAEVSIATSSSVDSKALTAIEEKLEANPDTLLSEKAFGEIENKASWIYKLNSMTFRKHRNIPWYINQLAKQSNKSAEEIINQQLDEYDLPLIDFTSNRYYISPTVLPPDVRRIINSMPSTGKNFRALSISHSTRDPGDRYRPMLNLIASQESSNDTVHGGYDALNTGGYGRYPEGTSTGERNFGRPLTSFTIQEIIDRQQSGLLMAAGRYQFVPATLIEQVRDQNIDPNSLFDEATQDRLAIGYVHTSIGTFRSIGEDVIYGLGQRWHGLQNVSRAEMRRQIDLLDQDPRVNDNFSGLDYKESALKLHYNK